MRDTHFLVALRVALDVREVRRLQQSGCPPLPALVAGFPDAWADDEQAHIRTCLRCQKLTGVLREDSTVRIPVDALSAWRPRTTASGFWAAAATAGPLDLTLPSPDERLQVWLVEEEGELVLEARTQDDRLKREAIHYGLRGADGREVLAGFLILSADANGWSSAHQRLSDLKARLDRADSRFGGGTVSLVELERFTPRHRTFLLEAVRAADPQQREHWRAWAERRLLRATTLVEGSRQLLAAVLKEVPEQPPR